MIRIKFVYRDSDDRIIGDVQDMVFDGIKEFDEFISHSNDVELFVEVISIKDITVSGWVKALYYMGIAGGLQ